jgi:hypothetical protein
MESSSSIGMLGTSSTVGNCGVTCASRRVGIIGGGQRRRLDSEPKTLPGMSRQGRRISAPGCTLAR